MCLIVLAWQAHPQYDLLLAANRDEFHARPTERAHAWDAPAGLFAGRDIRAGGAWCGGDASGRFAAVTNIRDPSAEPGQRSRGALVRDYFAADRSAREWVDRVAEDADAYGPFNLLVGDADALYWLANRGDRGPHRIAPGVIALSNGRPGDRWPKTERATARMQAALDTDRVDADHLLTLLADTEPADPSRLPDTGIDPETERFLSSMFIQSATYGTRAATVMRREPGRCFDFVEQGFDPAGQAVHRVQHHWPIAIRST